MPQAQEGFGADDRTTLGGDLGLVMDFEPAFIQTLAKITLQVLALANELIHAGDEETAAVPAIGLGPIHGDIGIHQELFGVLGMSREDRDSDAGADQDVMAVDRKGAR